MWKTIGTAAALAIVGLAVFSKTVQKARVEKAIAAGIAFEPVEEDERQLAKERFKEALQHAA